MQKKHFMDIDWSPYLTRVEHLARRATEALNERNYTEAQEALFEIERNAFNCRHWIKENSDGKAA